MTDRLTIGDVRRAGYCVRGSRRWCEANGIDFRTFTREGIAISEIAHIDDCILQEILRKREAWTDGL